MLFEVNIASVRQSFHCCKFELRLLKLVPLFANFLILLAYCNEILFSTRSSTTLIQHDILKYKKLVYQYLSGQLLTAKLILHKTPHTPSSFPKKIVLSIAESFRNIHFLQHFY